MNKKARVIAYYLPQFHPIPENDEWWGKGFTEWTNVGKAKPLFRGHYQPRVPADLGYYDLRLPEIREQQAQMARDAGIEGFCYWHYWFGNGKRLLERPFNEVLASGKPDFPFCLGWANESWKGFPHGLTNRNTLIEQRYPGIDDYKAHFYTVLPAFKDRRYITVDKKPFFLIYKPLDNPEVMVFIETWRKLARENGLSGIHFVGYLDSNGHSIKQIMNTKVDAVNTVRLDKYLFNRSLSKKIYDKLNKIIFDMPFKYQYKKMSKYFIDAEEDTIENVYPSIVPGWDHTPRSGKNGLIMTNTTPNQFEKHIKKAMSVVEDKRYEHRIIMLKSWNEWAEGNYMEPDLKWGMQYLEHLKKVIVT
jgi:hypothetical protein